jgi:hypothetical protein
MGYKSLDKYRLKGRGTVYIVENDKHRNNSGDKDGLIGSKVIIDNEEHVVRAVEAFAIPTINKGDKIGLLV